MKHWKMPQKYSLALMGCLMLMVGGLLWSAQNFKKDLHIEKVEVIIEALPAGGNMLESDQISDHFLNTLGFQPQDIPMSRVAMTHWEKIIEKLDFVRRADLYIDRTQTLNIRVQQRKPVLRCIYKGQSYYIDQSGKLLPTTSAYTPRLPVLHGSWPQNPEEAWEKELLEIITYFDTQEYERRLIDQIYRNDDGTYTLIPVLGHLDIHFGHWESVSEKFQRLQHFFDEVLPEKGWTKYESIDVSFDDQVIAKMKV